MNQTSKWRVRLAFLFLFVFMIALAVGAYFITDMAKLAQRTAAAESQTALQGITDQNQIDQALRQHPANKVLQLIAMATKTAHETGAAAEQLSAEIEPPSLAKNLNLATASRSDLEALRRDLELAEANAKALMPRTTALIKNQRDQLEAYAVSLHAEKDLAGRLLDEVDKRNAKFADLTSRLFSARADYYRAYQRYVAFLLSEFGAYKVVDGQLVFPIQSTYIRYNAAANAMTAAGKRVTELEQERARLMQAQQEGWDQIVGGR